MVKVDVPAGESILLRFTGGVEIVCSQDTYTGQVRARVECSERRRLRFLWLPANLVHRVREALLVEVPGPGEEEETLP